MALPTPQRAFPDPNASRLWDQWQPGGVLLANMSRGEASSTQTPPATATTILAGGLVLPANRTVTGIVVWLSAAGATYTIRHFTLTDINRVVLQRTANATTTPSTGKLATALQATYTPTVDTLAYVGISIAAATAPTLVASPVATAAWMAEPNLVAGNSATVPTTTPPALGATLAAPAAGATQLIWVGTF